MSAGAASPGAAFRRTPTLLQSARDLGADAILFVPGWVTSEVRYTDVYKRSQKRIRKLFPIAAGLNFVIAVKSIGNRFVLLTSNSRLCISPDSIRPWGTLEDAYSNSPFFIDNNGDREAAGRIEAQANSGHSEDLSAGIPARHRCPW